ncbi:MAG TPA: site-2 protease family protein [Ktedonobacteraceae bacterium]|nr:site-2 protease family protein [Ktedonobacteraceae bacterium]
MIINVLLALMIVISFLLAIVLHEWAHAQVASWLGDQTPRLEGRQTLSLRAHLDPVGLVMCLILAFQPLSMSAVPPAGLGWGKPVKPDPWKMRVPADTGVLLVACAGLIFSLIIGLLTAVLFRFLDPILDSSFFAHVLRQWVVVFASVNISLALFNLIPLYPLDGYQILYTLLPSKQAVQFSRSAIYGPFIILALFFFLPFIGRLAGVAEFPLFRLTFYIWLGALALISLVTGHPITNLMSTYLV